MMDALDAIAPRPGDGADAWIEWCLARLQFYERAAEHDPMTNSVRRLAYDCLERLQEDEGADSALVAAAKGLADAALIERAENLGRVHEGAEADGGSVNDLLASFEGQTFETARDALERFRAGIVFTAHPTFAMSAAQRAAMAILATAPGDKDAKAAIAKLAHAPDQPITLGDEHAAVQAAIRRAKSALRGVTDNILAWAQQHYPDRWRELAPAPISVASWVGYDLDGRTDIHWGETFRLRLEEKAQQLGGYANQLRTIDLDDANAKRDALADRLSNAAALANEQAALFTGDLDDPDRVTKAANTLTKDEPRRLISLKDIIDDVDAFIDDARHPDALRQLCILKSEMRSYGLGVAHIHLRINAAQVRSALRADLGIEQGRAFIDRTALAAAAEKAGSVSKRRVNIASIFLEQMTARRQLMLSAEFLKHIDADTPIRFLIAECEAPATVMGAVYLARLYGVEHRLDISPLFETPEAIERGGRFMERLLAEEEFVNYIRKRGRVAVQIGFSDSGRFMGQAAANLAIERLQILIARALAERDIRDVDVVIFNTHGESMGRGGFPGSLKERFDYLMSPWTRARYAREQINTKPECSFQGGDGFLHFETDDLAASTVAALLRWSFEKHEADRRDRYYSDLDYSWDFYRSIKNWQEALFENPDYHKTIGAFAPNLLFSTGSRKVRRQSGAAITGPRSLRAIPHNAILQQLAAPANVFGGVGMAAGPEGDRLADHVRGSSRMQEVIAIVRNARRLTSLPAMRAYAILFDASFWISKASREQNPGAAAACEEIAAHLSDQETPTAIRRLANHFAADLVKLDRIFLDLDGAAQRTERHEDRRGMHALHAIRQALIMKALMLVATLPSFSQRHDVSRRTLFELAFQLRFDELADLSEQIFPAVDASAAALSGIEEESDEWEAAKRGYPEIHRNVIEPLRQIHQIIREIGVGLSHHYRAYG